jgi:hypothetical protein
LYICHQEKNKSKPYIIVIMTTRKKQTQTFHCCNYGNKKKKEPTLATSHTCDITKKKR